MSPADYVIQPHRFFDQRRFTTASTFLFSIFLFRVQETISNSVLAAESIMNGIPQELQRIWYLCSPRQEEKKETEATNLKRDRITFLVHESQE